MNISFLKEKGNKYLVFILVGILILVVLLPTNSTVQQDATVQENIQEGDMEGQLKRVLSSMEGVGEVEVMLTTESEADSLFGADKASPKVSGVVVVAEGAGEPLVDARISEAVKALFSVDAHKISIVKMRSQEGDR